MTIYSKQFKANDSVRSVAVIPAPVAINSVINSLQTVRLTPSILSTTHFPMSLR